MSESWRPSIDFEDEMMSIQPDCDLIFPEHGKNPESLAGLTLKNDIQKIFRENGETHTMPIEGSKVLQIVEKIRDSMPGKRFIGRLLTEDDLEDETGREAETIAMIRSSGMAPCYDFPLESKNTLPTISRKESYKISNGQPLLLGSEFFKLKPRNSSSETSTSKSDDISSDSLHFKTFTLLESDESISNGSSSILADSSLDSAGKSVSSQSSLPPKTSKKKNRAMNQIRKQSRTFGDKFRILDSQSNEDNVHMSYRHDDFITPKQLYMKKRATKS